MRTLIVALAATLFIRSGNSSAEQSFKDALTEYENINRANQLYIEKHPSALRPQGADINKVLKAMTGSTTPKTQIYNNDKDPRSNPDQWDKIESPNKICWFHKGTRRKVCEQK